MALPGETRILDKDVNQVRPVYVPHREFVPTPQKDVGILFGKHDRMSLLGDGAHRQ